MLKHSFGSHSAAPQDGAPDSVRSQELPESLLKCYDLLCNGGRALHAQKIDQTLSPI